MSRTWLLFLICLFLLTLLAPMTRAGLTIRVDDSAVRVLFDEQGTRVLLPIEVARGQALDARVKVELIDTHGRTAVTVDRDYHLSAGRNELAIPIGSWVTGKTQDTRELLWYRLRYGISPVAAAEFDNVSNIISLSQITPDIFALNVMASRTVMLSTS